MNPYVSKVLALAEKEVGVRESNNNSGVRVREYQAVTTLGGTHWPWCAAFIAWLILKAMGAKLASAVWVMTASCDVVLDFAKRKKLVSRVPIAGCAGLVMAKGSSTDATHIFLVTRVTKHGVHTIEGNTNTDGGREGNGVYRRFRPHSSRYIYVIYERLVPDEVAPALATAPPKPRTYEFYFGDKKVGDFPVLDGHVMLEAWKWAAWMRTDIKWLEESQTVAIGGREVPAQPMIIRDGSGEPRSWFPITTLAEFSQLHWKANHDERKLIVTKEPLE